MAEITTSGGIIIIAPSNLIAESLLPGQTKRNTFLLRIMDIFEVV